MITDLLFPNRCLKCNRIIEADVLLCTLCYQHIPFCQDSYSPYSYLSNKCKTLFPLESAFALMYFKEASLSRDIIHELKYRSREKAGKIIAEWTIERLHFSDAKPDILVTIPLHFRKLRQRGYNQLHLFTDTLSDHYYIPSDHDLLKRNYYSKAQALRNKKHRLETQNMFSIDRPVSGKHILLIDDVFTTGNTLAACAWEILKSGGNKVSVLVMAVDE